jgi:hypothetical protein
VYINLTPHDINLLHANGNILTFPPSGRVAMVVHDDTQSIWTIDGIQLAACSSNHVVGLPPTKQDVYYITSPRVAEHPDCWGRNDVLYPANLVRDPRRRILYARQLMYPPPHDTEGRCTR